MEDYQKSDKSRMRYWLKELKEKFAKNPESLTLRNGIARIEEILEIQNSVRPVDSLVWIEEKMKLMEEEKKGR
jgi:hypothetical protein